MSGTDIVKGVTGYRAHRNPVNLHVAYFVTAARGNAYCLRSIVLHPGIGRGDGTVCARGRHEVVVPNCEGRRYGMVSRRIAERVTVAPLGDV